MFKAIFLYPISLLYAFVANFRNFLFDIDIIKSTEFEIPIISVGNITVGGTGKTPHVEYLINLLKPEYRVAVLSRGYMRKTKGFVLADEKSDSNIIGDELMQIKLKYPDIIIAAAEKRVEGIKRLQELVEKPDLIILDDAYQHRYVKPGLSILLIDYTKPFFNDFYLPFGRLRESPGQRTRANIIIVTKAPPKLKPIDMRIMAKKVNLFPYQSLYFSSIEYKKLNRVYASEQEILDIENLKLENYSILLVTGIANSETIEEYISNYSSDIYHLKFKDHFDFTQLEIEKIQDEFLKIQNSKKIIITTEKDSAKLRNFEITNVNMRERMYFLPIQINILNNEQDDVEKQILNYVKKDKTNYRFQTTKRQY